MRKLKESLVKPGSARTALGAVGGAGTGQYEKGEFFVENFGNF